MRRSRTMLRGSGLLALGALTSAGLAGPVQASQIRTAFVIAMENHNWAQPASLSSPGQILGSPYAPYINSLVTPGNPNAAQVSYASNYQNVGVGVHPSEPSYHMERGRLEPRGVQRQ